MFNSVHAVVISSFGESAGGEESIACTSKVCARTEGIYDFLKPTESINGIRVSIVEADGKIYK
ncbi:MAG: hypothetical protein IJE04_03420 [Bacilli bacterium]|nr:hypothetical protein [Bacilli bacterium]